jgi:hypothetical protein
MIIKNLYSKRNALVNDKLDYSLSDGLKIQIIHIWNDYFNELYGFNPDLAGEALKNIIKILCREHKLKSILEDGYLLRHSDLDRLEYHFENNKETDKCLDVIEITFSYMETADDYLEKNHYGYLGRVYKNEQAIKDLNERFLENNVGFEYTNGIIIKIDNKLLHKEITSTTLHFISGELFNNVNEEYLKAHKHHLHGDEEECLTKCSCALESTMKIICRQNKWQFEENFPASKLIEVCQKNGLFPAYLLTHYSSFVAAIKSGVPTIRNKNGSHGKGDNPLNVPKHWGAYMLYLTGTTITFLISCHNELNDGKETNL